MYSATVRGEVMGTWKCSEHGAQTCVASQGLHQMTTGLSHLHGTSPCIHPVLVSLCVNLARLQYPAV